MKYLFILFTFALVCTSCDSDDNNNNSDNNPNLIVPLVNINLNLDLPQFNALMFPGNSIVLEQLGVRGIVVFNLNNELYTAFDLADPNHAIMSCSTMELDGIIASCPCTTDDNTYDILSGQHVDQPGLFPMQAYRAVRNGNIVQVSN